MIDIAGKSYIPNYGGALLGGIKSGLDIRNQMLEQEVLRNNMQQQQEGRLLGQQYVQATGDQKQLLGQRLQAYPDLYKGILSNEKMLRESRQGRFDQETQFFAKAAIQLKNTPEAQRPQVYNQLQSMAVQQGIMSPGEVEPYSAKVMDELQPFLYQSQDIQPPTALERQLQAAGLKEGTPEYSQSLMNAIMKPETQVNIGDKASAAGTKKFAENVGEMASSRIAEAQSAQQQNQQLDRVLLSLSRGAQTGSGEEFFLDMKNLGNTMFGLDLPESAQEQEVIRKVSNEMALRLRNPESGLGLTGSTSNKDLQFLKDSVIGLARSEGGNAKLIDLMKRMNDLRIATSREQARIVREEGGVPLDIDDRLMEFVNNYDLLSDDEIKEIKDFTKNAGKTSSSMSKSIPQDLPREVMQEWDYLTPEERKLWQQ